MPWFVIISVILNTLSKKDTTEQMKENLVLNWSAEAPNIQKRALNIQRTFPED